MRLCRIRKRRGVDNIKVLAINRLGFFKAVCSSAHSVAGFANSLGSTCSRGNTTLGLKVVGGVVATKLLLTFLGHLLLLYNELLTALTLGIN